MVDLSKALRPTPTAASTPPPLAQIAARAQQRRQRRRVAAASGSVAAAVVAVVAAISLVGGSPGSDISTIDAANDPDVTEPATSEVTTSAPVTTGPAMSTADPSERIPSTLDDTEPGDAPTGDSAAGGEPATEPMPTTANQSETSPGLETTSTTTSSWEDGYCTTIRVDNTTSAPLTWRLTVDVDGDIATVWSAVVTDDDGGGRGPTTFVGADWNAVLDPGGWTTFGLCIDT